MSAKEVVWRLGQNAIALTERTRFGRKYHPVDRPIYRAARSLVFNPAPLGIATDAPHPIDTSHSIHLLGGYDYAEYATDWHAGFQTPQQWPVKWSYSLDFKGRDDIGDARTNWELNRHAQWVLMAKAYYLTADLSHLAALAAELDSWTRRNPFLWGISWTSPMEIALRTINWLYAAAFLRTAAEDAPSPQARDLTARLTTGAANMAAYLAKHYSRGSSANNHLLVEMAALWLAGASLSHPSWCRKALRVLSRELPRQFSPDGVNREMSLHYHAFAMEAYLIVAHGLRATDQAIPAEWLDMLGRSAEFVAQSRVDSGFWAVFGDDDEGHILNFSSGKSDYYSYILQFSSLIAGNRRYDSFATLNPTAAWLFRAAEVEAIASTPLYDAGQSHTFAQGGYTFLRRDGLTAAIDHAPLGFGTIAAHGHADALSIQLWADGRPVVTDPGTYIYHINRPMRDAYRYSHSTVAINDCQQSEILGAFLWGKRAQTDLIAYDTTSVEATATGLSGVAHTRRVELLAERQVAVRDSFSQPCSWAAYFILAPGITAEVDDHGVDLGPIGRIDIVTPGATATVATTPYSPAYGVDSRTALIVVEGRGSQADFTFKLPANPQHESKNTHNS